LIQYYFLFLLTYGFIADSSLGIGLGALNLDSPADKTELPDKTWASLLNILQQTVMAKPEIKVEVVDFLVDNFSNIFDK